MKKISKLIISIIILISLLLPNTLQVSATEGAGDSGIISGGTIRLVEGFNSGKTGWLISLAKEDGSPIDAVFVTTTRNPIFSTTGVSVDTSGLVGRFGARYSKVFKGAEWGFAPFSGGNGTGNGRALKQWLLSEYKDGATGCAWVLKNYFGYSDDQIAEWGSDDTNRMICEGVVWCGAYQGSAFQGYVYLGTSTSWAKKTDNNTWLSRITHGNLPNSHYIDIDNFITGITVPNNVSSKHDSSEILSNQGLGLVSIKPKEGIRLIQVFRTESKVDNTSYSVCSLPYEIKDIGGYKAKNWFLSNKTTSEKGAKTDYPVFQSLLPSIASGNGPGTVPENKQAQTLVILYERENVELPREEDQDALKAWENDWVMERYVSDRSGETDVNNSHIVMSDIQEVYDSIASQANVVIDNFEYDEEYTINADLGYWQTPIWNLYNPPVHYGLWDRYTKALNSNVYSVNDEVDPQFSYYLVRSLWEQLAISPDREGESGFLSKITSPYHGYPTQYTGICSLSQPDNTEILREERYQYSYTFTTSPIHIRIDYHLEIEHDEVKDEVTGEVLEEGYTERIDKEPLDKYYEFIIAQGSTGDNKAYKYRAPATPIANSEKAGSIIDEYYGDGLKGNFGGSSSITAPDGYTSEFEWKPIEAQSVASEFRGNTIKLYPEVLMTVWENESAYEYKATPKELGVYVMGEIQREFIGSIVHGYNVTIDKGTMQGVGSLYSPATGYTAQSIMNNPKAQSDLGATVQGTGFDVATTSHYVMNINTVAIVPSDSEAHGEWGNSLTKEDAIASHEAYVESLLSLATQDLIMEYEFQPSGQKLYYRLINGGKSDLIRDDDQQEVDIYFHDGNYDQRDTVISYCKSLYPYDETTYNNGLNLDEIFDTIFVSNTDPDNNSSGYTGDSVDLSHKCWYDEESKDKLTVIKISSKIVFPLIDASDKASYNLMTQSVLSHYLNQSNFINVKFYNRLYMDLTGGSEAATRADSFSWPHSGDFRVEHINGCDFVVINQSTQNMKSTN